MLDRGVHGHMHGSRPWVWAENELEEMMGDVVGEKAEQAEVLRGFCSLKS